MKGVVFEESREKNASERRCYPAKGKPASCSANGGMPLEAKVGDAVKKGDTLLILEIMKMETPVVAPQDGTVASIDVAVGDSVESGKVLVSMN